MVIEIHPNEPSLKELLEIQKDGTLTDAQRHALVTQIARHKLAAKENATEKVIVPE